MANCIFQLIDKFFYFDAGTHECKMPTAYKMSWENKKHEKRTNKAYLTSVIDFPEARASSCTDSQADTHNAKSD